MFSALRKDWLTIFWNRTVDCTAPPAKYENKASQLWSMWFSLIKYNATVTGIRPHYTALLSNSFKLSVCLDQCWESRISRMFTLCLYAVSVMYTAVRQPLYVHSTVYSLNTPSYSYTGSVQWKSTLIGQGVIFIHTCMDFYYNLKGIVGLKVYFILIFYQRPQYSSISDYLVSCFII